MTLSDRDRHFAYQYWLYHCYEHQEIDRKVEPYLKLPKCEFGWLRAARLALHFPGSRPGISHQQFSKFEKNELRGSISIAALKRAAEAIDCELVYAIRPKAKNKFSRIIWEILEAEATKHPYVRNTKNKYQALQHIASLKMSDDKFRRRHGWSERITPSRDP